MGEKYLSIKNWGTFQKQMGRREWVRDYTEKDGDHEYSKLSAFQRYVLDGLQRLRGRTGKNPPNDATHIAQALHMIGTDRPHLHHALITLTSRGFVVPTNQQHDSIEEKREEEKREEKQNKSVPAEPVLEMSKPEPVKPKQGPLAIVETKVFELPVWIDRETWMDFEIMRRKINKPLTLRGRDITVKKLLSLMNRGHPPQEVLEQSIMNCWAGVFELRQSNERNNTGNTPTRSAAELLAERDERARNGLADLRRRGILPKNG